MGKKPVSAKKPVQEEPKKTPAKVPAKAPAKVTPKATPAPQYPKFEELKAARESAQKSTVETPQPTTETAKEKITEEANTSEPPQLIVVPKARGSPRKRP